jgi:RNA polymerase sigma factor (sigma-70 family)
LEASALRQTPAIHARSPLLRLQGDEKLVALTRRGHHAAFEALVDRYHARLLAFCRHMLGSTEDAEDVLQEVFTAAFNAICADDRPINARPWLYRIARNRCLNHLRRPQHAGQDSMDVFERDGGATTADTVHTREEFRQIVADVQELPETQRTALLLREIDALSYEQIAEAMDTTVPSVKSLLVRARVSLAEAAEARLLTCEEVRLELGQVAEGLTRTSAPVRRHVRSCDRCKVFRRELRNTSRALAAVYPIGALAIAKNFVLAKLGAAGGGAAAGGAAAGSAAGGGAAVGGAGFAGAGAMGGATAGGVISAGVGAVATKAAAGLAAAALVTAGAVEVKHASHPARTAQTPARVAQAPAVPQVVAAQPQAITPAAHHKARHASKKPKAAEPSKPVVAPATATTPAPAAPAPAPTTDQGGSTVSLPQQGPTGTTGPQPDPTATGGSPQPTSTQPAPATPTDPTQPSGGTTGATGPTTPQPDSGDPPQQQTEPAPGE